MKKKLITKIMTVALVVAMAMPQFAMSVHAEETDGVVSANEIVVENTETTLTLGQTQNGGSIDSVDDVDTYVIQINQPGEYSIILNDNSNDLYVDVFQGRNSDSIACNSSVSAGIKKYFHVNVAGEYIITVSADDTVDDNSGGYVEQPEVRIGTTYGITVYKEEGDNWIGGYTNRFADIEFNRWYKDSSETGWEYYYYDVPADGYITIEVKYDDVKQVRQHWWINLTEPQYFQIYGTGESYTTEKIFVEKGDNYELQVVTQWGQDVPYDFIVRYERTDASSGSNADEQKINDFVSRMYTVALSRESEAAGQADWSNQLINQEIDGAGIANGFINSAEFKNRNLSNSDFLDTLYQTFFNRAADEGGKSNWMTFLNNGGSRNEVLAGFVNSQEFSNLCDNYGIARGTMQADGSSIYKPGVRNYVLRMYTVALSRDGETLGVEDWSNRINTGAMNPEEVAKSFFSSQEFLNRNLSNEDYVETLYETFMDRSSDAAGKADWVGRLNAGVSRQEVLEGFSRSPEFGNIMKSYGL